MADLSEANAFKEAACSHQHENTFLLLVIGERVCNAGSIVD
jgi:hypothetical protein